MSSNQNIGLKVLNTHNTKFLSPGKAKKCDFLLMCKDCREIAAFYKNFFMFQRSKLRGIWCFYLALFIIYTQKFKKLSAPGRRARLHAGFRQIVEIY